MAQLYNPASMMRFLVFILLIVCSSRAWAIQENLPTLNLPSGIQLHSIWQSPQGQLSAIDAVYVRKDYSLKLFVKHNISMSKAKDKGRWFKAAKGYAYNLDRGSKGKALYLEGESTPALRQQITVKIAKQRFAYQSVLIPQLWAETTSGQKARLAFHKKRMSKSSINYLKCLGDGALAGVNGFVDGVQNVKNFLNLLVTDQKAAWKQVSSAFKDTIEFVTTIRQQILEAVSFLNDLSPRARALIVCQITGGVLASMGAGALAGGLVPALRQAGVYIKGYVKDLKRNRGAIEQLALASENMSDDAFFKRLNKISQESKKPSLFSARRSSKPTSFASPQAMYDSYGDLIKAMHFTFNKDTGDLNHKISPSAITGGIQNQIQKLSDDFGVQFRLSPEPRQSHYAVENGKEVFYVDPKFLSDKNYRKEQLELVVAQLEKGKLSRSARLNHGFRLNKEWEAEFTGDPTSEIGRMLYKLQKKHGVKVTFDDGEIPEGASAISRGTRDVHINREFLEPGREKELKGLLLHEITHNTKTRATNKSNRNARNSVRKGARDTKASLLRYTGQTIEFHSKSFKRFEAEAKVYRTSFRADEVEARIGQMRSLKDSPEEYKYVRGRLSDFVDTQLEAIESLGKDIRPVLSDRGNNQYELVGESGEKLIVNLNHIDKIHYMRRDDVHQMVRDAVNQRREYLKRLKADLDNGVSEVIKEGKTQLRRERRRAKGYTGPGKAPDPNWRPSDPSRRYDPPEQKPSSRSRKRNP